jgi:hypothetical protein
MVMPFPARTVSSVAPPSAAAAVEASSLCERVKFAILSSKIAKRPRSRYCQQFPSVAGTAPLRKLQGSLSATGLSLIQIKKLTTKSPGNVCFWG